MVRILALCGSLRSASKNRAALLSARRVASPGCELIIWNSIAGLPHFSPDLDQPGLELPPTVSAFHAEIEASDGILIACPEYAHGIPGAFKNALDWLVGSSVFPGKPVALLNVAPHASHAQAQLRGVLKTMSAEIVEEACLAISLPGDVPPDACATCTASLRDMLCAFQAHLRRQALAR